MLIYKNIIYYYIYDGLYRGSTSPNPELQFTLGGISMYIAINHTFTTKDGKYYTNNVGDSFIEDPNSFKDIL